VVGLVAITPGAGFVSVGSSVAIGALAAAISNYAVHWKSRSPLDDTLDVFPCHGVGGIVGMVATAVFADKRINPDGADGLLYGGTALFTSHILALFAVGAAVIALSWLLYKAVDLLSPMRVDAEQEALGLDLSQHGESVRSSD
jgi:Amt family ammonium transporter